MASAAPRPASLDRARFDRLMAAKQDAQARLAATETAVKAFCARYSQAHRFGVILTPEQVARDLEAQG